MKKIYILISAFLVICGFSLKAQDQFVTAVPVTSTLVENLPVDIQVKPVSGTASSFEEGLNIDKSYDGIFITNYSSAKKDAGQSPITTLQYNFSNVAKIDYFLYRPRTYGTEGNFKEIKVIYKLEGASEVEYKTVNFNGSSSPSEFSFETPLVKPEYIKIVVNSAVNDIATCAEMEFYERHPDSFDYTDFFTDITCSEIKASVTAEDVKGIKNEFYKKMVEDIFYDEYDGKEFRIQSYEAYVNPEITALQNKTSKYGRRDNPTGIYVTKGEPLVLFAGASDEATYPQVFIQKPEGTSFTGTYYTLQPGLNIITPTFDGLVYVIYYTETGTEKPVKINFVTGGVNGYFDLAKHNAEDWKRLIDNAPFPYFDAIGEYSFLNFETEAFRKYTKDKGPELVQAYDNLVYSEMEFMGLVKYKKLFPTRMHFQVVYGDNFMYASDYFTGYNDGTQNSVLDYDKLIDTRYTSGWAGGTAWGPAHEVGHCNQTRPGLKWQGMTEVTNNILSQYITTSWGMPSRLNDEVLSATYGNRYNKAIKIIVEAQAPHNNHNDPENKNPNNGDVFCKLVPFWQLKLYIHDVLGNDDFYKEIYENIRITPNLTDGSNGCSLDGQYQLNFTKLVCEKSGYDFTEFFEDWGFYRPVSVVVDDYSQKKFIVTEEGATAKKAEIAALGLPKPPVPVGKKLYEITDKNKMDFKVE